MGNKNWMYYTAYAVLVIGAGMALIMSQRPLSSTVVTLALFSFNLAAIIFLTPAVLGYIGQLRTSAENNNADVMKQISDLKDQVNLLTEEANARLEANEREEASDDSEQISLGNALKETKANTSLTIDTIQTSARPISPPVQAAQASTAPVLPVITPSLVITSAPLANPLAAPVTEKPQQTDLFSASREEAPAAPEATVSVNPPLASEVEETLSTPENEMTNTPSINDDSKSSTNTNSEATLFVTVHVEDDDVLCIRGEGSGLNWQEGIPMNYEGADRWSWKSDMISAPITCRVYLNDEISAFGDDIELQPGQTIEAAPSFPKIEA